MIRNPVIRSVSNGYNRGMVTAVLTRAVVPGVLQAPVLLTAAGISSFLQSVSQFTQGLSNGFCIRKYNWAIAMMRLVDQCELASLLPPSYLVLHEVSQLGTLELIQEKLYSRQSRGAESLFNPCYLPTVAGLKNSESPLYVETVDYLENVSALPLLPLWRYFYDFAVNTCVDSDSRRTALVLLRLLDRQIELIETGTVTLFEGHLLTQALKKCIQMSFMEEHPAVFFSERTAGSRRHGRDDGLFRTVTGNRLPSLPDLATPIELIQRASDILLREFYGKNPLSVCDEVTASILRITKEILAELLRCSQFDLRKGFSPAELESSTGSDPLKNAVYRAFNHLKDGVFQDPRALSEKIRQQVGGIRLREHEDFAAALAVIGTIDSQMMQVKKIHAACEKEQNPDVPVSEVYFSGLKNIFEKIDQMLEEIFSTDRKNGVVSVRLYNAFSRCREQVEKLLCSVEVFMKNYRTDRSLSEEKQETPDITDRMSECREGVLGCIHMERRLVESELLRLKEAREDRLKQNKSAAHFDRNLRRLTVKADFLRSAEELFSKTADRINGLMMAAAAKADGNLLKCRRSFFSGGTHCQ